MKPHTNKHHTIEHHNTHNVAEHHHEHHDSEHQISHASKKNPKISNALIAVVSIFAIFLVTYFALTFRTNTLNSVDQIQNRDNVDSNGQVLNVVRQDVTSVSCKLLVSPTTLYDDKTLAVGLEAGSVTYYSGNIISVISVNDNGCVVGIGESNDYIAIGQIQRIGSLYVTVKEVVK
jgi:hypothetical protein